MKTKKLLIWSIIGICLIYIGINFYYAYQEIIYQKQEVKRHEEIKLQQQKENKDFKIKMENGLEVNYDNYQKIIGENPEKKSTKATFSVPIENNKPVHGILEISSGEQIIIITSATIETKFGESVIWADNVFTGENPECAWCHITNGTFKRSYMPPDNTGEICDKEYEKKYLFLVCPIFKKRIKERPKHLDFDFYLVPNRISSPFSIKITQE